MMKIIGLIVNVSLFISSVAYPIIWLFFYENSKLLFFLPWLMAVLWGIKGLLQRIVWQRYFAFAMAILLLLIGITRSIETMYWYPIIISGVMLFIFGSSLFAEQTIIERFARLQTPDLPEYGIVYTRRVTIVWTAFFIFNIIVTGTLILLENYQLWALFTGVISYLLMGIIMSVEYCIRQIVMKKYKHYE